MQRLFLIPIVLTTILAPLSGEGTYRLRPAADLPLVAAAIGLYGGALTVEGSPGTQVPRESLNPLDRRAVRDYSGELDDLGTLLSCSMLALPGITAAAGPVETGRLATYAVMYAEAVFITGGMKDLLKDAVPRWRPYTYEQGFQTEGDKDYYNSFPSGHTAYAFLGASFLTTTLRHEFPASPWRIPVSAAAWSLAAGTGALRIAAGEHFFTDVAAGALLGSAVGWLVPRLHEESAAPGGEVTVVPTAAGITFSLRL